MQFRKYFFLFFCAIPILSFAQQNKVDSLVTLLQKAKADTTRAKLIIQMTEVLYLSNPDTTMLLCNQVIEMAGKNIPNSNDKEICSFSLSKANAIHNIGTIYYIKGDTSKAVSHWQNALSIRKKFNDNSGLIESYEAFNLVFSKNDLLQTLENRLKILEIAEKFSDKEKISESLRKTANVYNMIGNSDKSFEYAFRCLKMNEETGNKKDIATTLGMIGAFYYRQGDYTNTIEYYQKSLAIHTEIENKKGVAINYNNIGLVYQKQGDTANALINFKKALTLNEELRDTQGKANTFRNIADVFRTQKNIIMALYYYEKSLEGEKALSKAILLSSYNGIGETYLLANNFLLAEQYGDKALAGSKKMNFVESIKDAADLLQRIYRKQGRYKDALEMYELYVQMQDSINNDNSRKAIMKRQLQYEYEKKESTLKAEQEKKDAIVAEEKRRKNLFLLLVGAIAIAVAVIAGIIFRSLRITRKQKQIIEVQKTEVEKSKHIIEEKNKDITDSINYAKRIQQAKLPKREEINSAFPDSFVLFKPKDIVSGDFYYFHKNDKCVFIASADCTGHGVPGAFMSMIGSEKLDDALAHSADTSEILRHLNKGIKSSLRQTDSDESTRDGMDIALCSVDTDARVVKYAGANLLCLLHN